MGAGGAWNSVLDGAADTGFLWCQLAVVDRLLVGGVTEPQSSGGFADVTRPRVSKRDLTLAELDEDIKREKLSYVRLGL